MAAHGKLEFNQLLAVRTEQSVEDSSAATTASQSQSQITLLTNKKSAKPTKKLDDGETIGQEFKLGFLSANGDYTDAEGYNNLRNQYKTQKDTEQIKTTDDYWQHLKKHVANIEVALWPPAHVVKKIFWTPGSYGNWDEEWERVNPDKESEILIGRYHSPNKVDANGKPAKEEDEDSSDEGEVEHEGLDEQGNNIKKIEKKVFSEKLKWGRRERPPSPWATNAGDTAKPSKPKKVFHEKLEWKAKPRAPLSGAQAAKTTIPKTKSSKSIGAEVKLPPAKPNIAEKSADEKKKLELVRAKSVVVEKPKLLPVQIAEKGRPSLEGKNAGVGLGVDGTKKGFERHTAQIEELDLPEHHHKHHAHHHHHGHHHHVPKTTEEIEVADELGPSPPPKARNLSNHRLRVTNLAFDVTVGELQTLFPDGYITLDTSKPGKISAIVKFEDVLDAFTAFKKGKKLELNGKPLVVAPLVRD